MLVKNLVERSRVHDKADHTLVSHVTLTRWNHRETSQGQTIFRECSNHAATHKVKGAHKPSVFTPQGLDSEESVTASPSRFRSNLENILTCKLYLWTIETHDSSIILKIILTRRTSKWFNSSGSHSGSHHNTHHAKLVVLKGPTVVWLYSS